MARRCLLVAASLIIGTPVAFADTVSDRARDTLTDIVIQCFRGDGLRPNTDERRARCEEAKERWRLMPAVDRSDEAERWIDALSEAQRQTYQAYADAAKGKKEPDWSGAARWDAALGAISDALRR